MKKTLSFEKAKLARWFQTTIIDKYKGGDLTRLQDKTENGRSRAVYKVTKGTLVTILKTLSCDSNDAEYINKAKEEYKLYLEGSRVCEGVAKPTDFKEFIDTGLSQFFLEITYEYCGEDLYSLLDNADGRTVMKIMGEVAKIMITLEAHFIFHSDLKPENVAIKDNVVKLLDFGVASIFNRKTLMLKTGCLLGGTQDYLPPEVLTSYQGHPSRIDSYTWAMTLYELLIGKSDSTFQNECKLKTTNYSQFIGNIKKLTIKGDNDGTLKARAEFLLIKLLEKDYKIRPTLADLISLMLSDEYFQLSIKKLQKELVEITEERSIIFIITIDSLRKLCESLTDENGKFL